MHDLTPMTALGGTVPRADHIGPVTLTEEPGFAYASVAARLGREKPVATALKKLIGVAAPGPGASAGKADVTALWLGPDQWMIEAPFDTHELLADDVKTAMGDKASVTEQTDAWARFDLTGSGLHAVLERLCAVNTRAMAAGACTRTSLEHTGCLLVCRAPDTHFSVIGPRSTAGSIHHALVTAIKSAH